MVVIPNPYKVKKRELEKGDGLIWWNTHCPLSFYYLLLLGIINGPPLGRRLDAGALTASYHFTQGTLTTTVTRIECTMCEMYRATLGMASWVVVV